VCLQDGSKIIGYGSANSSTFVTARDGQVSLQYTSGWKSSTVFLKCDKSARTELFLRVEEITDKNVMSIYSVCACEGSCQCNCWAYV